MFPQDKERANGSVPYRSAFHPHPQTEETKLNIMVSVPGIKSTRIWTQVRSDFIQKGYAVKKGGL